MADEIPQQLTDNQDWTGNPPPVPTSPPPAWNDIKSTPEFGQLNPNQQLAAFAHWRTEALNHASTLPGADKDWENISQEFNANTQGEHQTLAKAAQDYITSHPNLTGFLEQPDELKPEGFFGTVGRAFASRIYPAIGTAAGAAVGAAGGAVATPELGGAGAILGAIGLGIAGGAATEEAQKSLMGDEWYDRNKKQMELNAQTHPVANQIGTLIPFLISAWTGAPEIQAAKGLVGKVVTEESGRIAKALGGAAERFITGGVSGGARAGALSGIEDKGQITSETMASGAGRGVATLGAVSLFPAMKTILGQSLKGVPDAVAMSVAGAVYDHYVDGQPFDFKKISQETGGSIAPFVLQNALLGFIHGVPLRGKTAEGPSSDTGTSKPEIEAALLQRQKDLDAKKADGTITPDQQKELDDHNQVIQMVQGETKPEAATPATPEVPAAQEAVAPKVETPAAPPVEDEVAKLQRARDNIEKTNLDPEVKAKMLQRLDDEIAQKKPAAPEPAAPEAKTELPPEKQAIVDQVNKGLETAQTAREEKINPAEVKKPTPTETMQDIFSGKGDQTNGWELTRTDNGEKVYHRDGQPYPLELEGVHVEPRRVVLPEPKTEVAPERVAAAEEGRPEAPLEKVSKTKQDSAQTLWKNDLDRGQRSTVQEYQKAFGQKAGTAAYKAMEDALKQVYPKTAGFSNDTNDIAKRLNAGEKIPVPKEAEENLNPTINLRRLPDGTAEVASVDHPDYGEIRNPGDLDKARAPAVAAKRAVQKTVDRIPESKPEYVAKTEELFGIATEKELEQLNQFMRNHNYDGHKLYDEIQGRALRAIVRGQKPDNNLIQLMIQRDRALNKEVPLPTPETGHEIGTQPEEITGEVKAEEAPAAAGTVAPETKEAAASPAEQKLIDSGIADPKGFLDQVNERMKAAGKPELTMEDIASKQERTLGAGTEATTPNQERGPIEKLQNTQKLAELGFYHNKENPVGEVIKNLAESGSPLEKLVAKLLLHSGVDFSKVKAVVDDLLDQRGHHFGDPSNNDYRIALNPSMEHGSKGIIGTLLHEAYHHVTAWKLQDGYVPSKYEAAAIKQLQKIMDAGRQAAFKESFGRDPKNQDEINKFIQFIQDPNSPDSIMWHRQQSLDIFHRLINNFDKYYGLANLKEMAAEITNPDFHNFVSNLPPTPTVGEAFKNLLHQFNKFLTQLVAGRPIPQMDRLRSYLEAAATLGVDAPRTRGIAGTELIPMMSSNEMVDRAMRESGEELPKSQGKYASIMRDAGVPYIGNFLGTHDQLAKDAQDELAKNPNAARERLDLLKEHKAGATAEDFHLFRAQLSQYRQEEVAARRAGDNDGVKAALAKADNWMQEVYNKTAEAGKALQAVQGALDINTGDFYDLKSYYKMVYGKEFTPAQEKEVQKIVQDTTQARIDTLKGEIKLGQQIAKTAEGTVNELGKETKGTKLTNAEKKAAIAAGISTVKDAAGKDTGQLDFGWDFDPAAAGKKLSQYLNARFEAKPFRPGQKNLTIREVGQIWKFIKANYLNGTEYVRPDELIKDVTADLNLKDSRIIKEAITAPKTIRDFSAARYAAQAQQRAIVNATKAWMELNSKGTPLAWAAKLWEAPRSLAVIGHVNPSLTHAGSLLFRPSRWGSEIPSIGQAFKASFGKTLWQMTTGQGENSQAYHESLMQDVMNTRDAKDGENVYAKLTSLGLAAKVGTLDDIGQYNNYLGKIGVAGNRGMDILKALRMDLGAKEYKALKGKDWFNALDQNGKDAVLREMTSRINSETGTTTPGFTKIGKLLTGDWRTFLFAPRLEGARWQQMVIDPFRAAGLYAFKPFSATAAEKYFRSRVVLRSAEMAGTYLAALTANAAILNAIGSDDKINFTDPTRSDWLAFKVHGQTVIAPSSFLAPLRLSLSVALSHVIPSENRQPYTDKIINYAMGKVTPSISDLVEITRAKQQYTGKPIEALQNLYENMGVKFATPKNPKDPISLFHWAMTKGPIPLSATTEAWYNALTDQGATPQLAQTIIGASIGLTGSIFAVHQHPTTPGKQAPNSSY